MRARLASGPWLLWGASLVLSGCPAFSPLAPEPDGLDAGAPDARVEGPADASLPALDPACVERLGARREPFEHSCDGVDNDCDRAVDETGCAKTSWSFSGMGLAVDEGSTVRCLTSAVGDSHLFVSVSFLEDGARTGALVAFPLTEGPAEPWVQPCDARATLEGSGERLLDRWAPADLADEAFPLVVTDEGDVVAGCRAPGGWTELRRYSASGRRSWTTRFDEDTDPRGAAPPAAYLEGSLPGGQLLVRSGSNTGWVYLVDATSGGVRAIQASPGAVLSAPVADRARGRFYLYALEREAPADVERPVDLLAGLVTVRAPSGEVPPPVDLRPLEVHQGPLHPIQLDGSGVLIFAGLESATTLVRVPLGTGAPQACRLPEITPVASSDAAVVGRLDGSADGGGPVGIGACPLDCSGAPCRAFTGAESVTLFGWQSAMVLANGRVLLDDGYGPRTCSLETAECQPMEAGKASALQGNHLTVGRDGAGYFCRGGRLDEGAGVSVWQVDAVGPDGAGWGMFHGDERATRSR